MSDLNTVAICIGAAAAGGALLGISGFLENMKDGDAFNAWKFGKSLLLAAISGIGVGIFAPTWELAFAAGFFGKTVQELASAHGIKI